MTASVTMGTSSAVYNVKPIQHNAMPIVDNHVAWVTLLIELDWSSRKSCVD